MPELYCLFTRPETDGDNAPVHTSTIIQEQKKIFEMSKTTKNYKMIFIVYNAMLRLIQIRYINKKGPNVPDKIATIDNKQ